MKKELTKAMVQSMVEGFDPDGDESDSGDEGTPG